MTAPTVRVVYWFWREAFYPELGVKYCHHRDWIPVHEVRQLSPLNSQ